MIVLFVGQNTYIYMTTNNDFNDCIVCSRCKFTCRIICDRERTNTASFTRFLVFTFFARDISDVQKQKSNK